jgi:hypothetical protein
MMTSPTAQLAPATGTSWSWLRAAVEMAALLSGHWPVDPAAAEEGAAGSGWSSAPRVAMRTPVPAPHSVAAARAFTLRTLHRWGVADCADDVAAVMSEFMTNALRHALAPASPSPASPGPADPSPADHGPASPGLAGVGSASPIRLALLHPGPCVLCAVADPSEALPVPRDPDSLSESGRGLQVVASLSHRWGYCPAPDHSGKVVWATILTSSPLV